MFHAHRVCSAHQILSKDPCWVYSLGSNGQIDFEEDVRARYPHCNVHIYDPTVDEGHALRIAEKTGVRVLPAHISARLRRPPGLKRRRIREACPSPSV